MKLNFINHSQTRLPRTYLEAFVAKTVRLLKKERLWPSPAPKNMQLVFLERGPAKVLNKRFRNKNYATDVLSFEPIEPDSLGELVFCPDVLQVQALEHGLSFRDELSYMVLHGLLHLLGFEHESNPKDAAKMFALQDRLFEKALPS